MIEPPVLPSAEVRSAEVSTGETGEHASVLPSLLALLVGPIAAAFVSMLVLAPFVLASSPAAGEQDFKERLAAWLADHAETLSGALIVILPGQATILALAFGMAASSRKGVRRRLGLVSWRSPIPTILMTVLGTLGVQWAVSIGFEAFGVEPSEHLKEVWRLISAPSGGAAVAVAVLVSVLPGFAEEVLYRGIGQRLFLERWPPLAAIGVASAIFAAGHLDVQHALAVFPIGVWLGFVAWRTGSVWLSAICHAANNLSAFVFGRLWGDPEFGSLPDTAPFLAGGTGLFLCTLLATWMLTRTKPVAG